jgi:cytochrome b involved in lipid metabolism
MEAWEVVLPLCILLAVLFAVLRSSRRQIESNTEEYGKLNELRENKRVYSEGEVAQHCREDDVWIIVEHRSSGERRVYDITTYADQHPGGDVIYDSAGKDATVKFHGPQHPPTVADLIEDYWIGWVKGGASGSGSAPFSLPEKKMA